MMKKLFALLLAIMMLAGVSAIAEDAPVTQEKYYSFSFDYEPEGYEKQVNDEDPDMLQIAFLGTTEDAPDYYFSVAYAEELGDVTMPAKDALTVEGYQEMQNQFSIDYNQPEFFYYDQTDKNGESVGIMVIHETDIASGDLGEMVSLWHGYLADIVIVKNSALTEDDYRVALQMVQELKVTEAAE